MIKQRIMYVCSECAEGCPEACGHYDRTELRVMPDGAWLCESCFDNNDDNEFLSWGHLPAPEEYGRIPASAQGAAQPVAWRVKNDFGHWYITQDKALADTWRDVEKYDVQPLYAALPGIGECTDDMAHAMSRLDGYDHDRDMPTLQRWKDYWDAAVAAAPAQVTEGSR